MFEKKSIHQEIMDICNKIFERALNCKVIKGEHGTTLTSPRLNEKDLPLLFSLPGIILTCLSSITGDKKYEYAINQIKDVLSKETECQKINSTLKKINKFADLEKYHETFNKELGLGFPKNLSDTLFLLLHPKSIQFDQPSVFKGLAVTFGNYFILSCMILQNAKMEQTEINHLSLENFHSLTDGIEEFGSVSNIFHFSLLYHEYMRMFSEATLNSYMNTGQKPLVRHSVIPVPSKELYLHKIIIMDNTFGCISNYKYFQSHYEDNIGIAYDINGYSNSDYELWELWPNEKNEEECVKNSIRGFYFFIDTKKNNTSVLTKLSIRLYEIIEEMSQLISDIIIFWNDFIDNPHKAKRLKIKSVIDYLTALTEHENTMKELNKFKSLERLLLGIDTYFSNRDIQGSEYDKRRRKIVTFSRKFISPELKRILEEANGEFENICQLIQKKSKKLIMIETISKKRKKSKTEKIIKNDELSQLKKNVWDENNFVYILQEDLKDLEYKSENNMKRGSRGRFLVEVASREGKELTENAIFEALGISR